MKKLIALASFLLASPVNAQSYPMSSSELTLADAYGALGANIGFLFCDARNIGINDPSKVFDNMYSRLTQGDAQMLDAVTEMPDNNFYKKRYMYNLMYQMEVSGCYEWFFDTLLKDN